MIYIKKDFEPDYNNIVLAAKNLQPKRTPVYEHVVSTRIFEEVTGIKIYTGQTGNNKLDTTENYRNYNNSFKALGYDAVIAGGELWNAEALRGVSGTVRMIARAGIGYDAIDLSAADDLGIVVANTPGSFSNAVAEGTLMLMLSALRNHRQYGLWEK